MATPIESAAATLSGPWLRTSSLCTTRFGPVVVPVPAAFIALPSEGHAIALRPLPGLRSAPRFHRAEGPGACGSSAIRFLGASDAPCCYGEDDSTREGRGAHGDVLGGGPSARNACRHDARGGTSA